MPRRLQPGRVLSSIISKKIWSLFLVLDPQLVRFQAQRKRANLIPVWCEEINEKEPIKVTILIVRSRRIFSSLNLLVGGVCPSLNLLNYKIRQLQHNRMMPNRRVATDENHLFSIIIIKQLKKIICSLFFVLDSQRVHC